MKKETQETFNQQAEEALAKQKKATKDFVTKIIPTALWAVATLFTAVSAFNDGKAFYIVTGIIAVIGAGIVTYKVYKDYSKEEKGEK